MNKPPDTDCCCGHPPRQHLNGTGKCLVCRRACEKFHGIGEGHFWAKIVFGLLVLVFAAAICLGAWAAHNLLTLPQHDHLAPALDVPLKETP